MNDRFNPAMLDDMARKLMDAMPPQLQGLRDDVEKNVREAVQTVLGRMNLVTREEFEVQMQVLAKTRQDLQLMTQRLEQLEQQMMQAKS